MTMSGSGGRLWWVESSVIGRFTADALKYPLFSGLHYSDCSAVDTALQQAYSALLMFLNAEFPCIFVWINVEWLENRKKNG